MTVEITVMGPVVSDERPEVMVTREAVEVTVVGSGVSEELEDELEDEVEVVEVVEVVEGVVVVEVVVVVELELEERGGRVVEVETGGFVVRESERVVSRSVVLQRKSQTVRSEMIL